uniref:Ig-like domain-containing protein n=1 Tax=Myripristis murdjan TaxID=586833 RepID=A0A668AVK7_9TELE
YNEYHDIFFFLTQLGLMKCSRGPQCPVSVAGSRIELPCHVLNSGNRMVQWVLPDGSKLMSPSSTPDGRLRALASGLLVQKLELSDAGLYHCVARAGRDADVLALRLAVEESSAPPSGEQVGPSVTGMVGEAVRLPCEASGSPTPDISWVLPDGSIIRRITMLTNGTLYISATIPSDRGMYRCVASNSAGAASASVRVHVSSLPPMIQQQREEHLILTAGMPVYAHCSARGAPTPTLRWRIPDGTLVRPSQFLHGNLFVLPNGTLHIQKLGPKDSGSYECMASNAVGADKRTVRVEVKEGVERPEKEGGRLNTLLYQISFILNHTVKQFTVYSQTYQLQLHLFVLQQTQTNHLTKTLRKVHLIVMGRFFDSYFDLHEHFLNFQVRFCSKAQVNSYAVWAAPSYKCV